MTRTELATQLREHVKQFEAVETIALLPHQRRMVSVAKSAELCSSALTIAAALEEAEQTIGQWQRYAAYCRSCALSGESDPHTFEQFVNYTTAALDEGKTHAE
jgi:hypothetical protein